MLRHQLTSSRCTRPVAFPTLETDLQCSELTPPGNGSALHMVPASARTQSLKDCTLQSTT